MQQHAPATPDASATTPASRLDAIRAIVVEHHRPTFGVPLDGEQGAVATAAPGTSGSDPLGLAPASSTSDSTAGPTVTLALGNGQTAGQTPATPATIAPVSAPPVTPAPPATPPATQPPAATAPPATPPPPGAGTALADAPLDSFPPEIRDYVKELRKEAGDYRMKAKTAEDQAAEAATAAKTAFVEQILKATGLIGDPEAAGAAELTPEQQVQAATQQVQALTSERDTAATAAVDARRELAIWQSAPEAGADARRLTDSRTFMDSIKGLDVNAADYKTALATAIGTAVQADSYYRAATGQTPAQQLPQVPSGGDFSGGPAGTADQPTTVDAFRELLRKSKAEQRGDKVS